MSSKPFPLLSSGSSQERPFQCDAGGQREPCQCARVRESYPEADCMALAEIFNDQDFYCVDGHASPGKESEESLFTARAAGYQREDYQFSLRAKRRLVYLGSKSYHLIKRQPEGVFQESFWELHKAERRLARLQELLEQTFPPEL